MTTALTKLTASAREIDNIAAESAVAFRDADKFENALIVADAMTQIRERLTPEMMAPVMKLMNSPLGFLTDKDPKQIDRKTDKPNIPYAIEVVKDCFIESKLRGFHPVGNEWNIIAGRFYAAKNGFRRKLTDGKTFSGLSEFKDNYDVPRLVGDKGAVVKCKATWKLNGKEDGMECEIAVKVNEYMGVDGIAGKAERKFLRRVHDRLSGQNTPEAEVGDEVPAEKNVTPQPKPVFGETPQARLQKVVTAAGWTFEKFCEQYSKAEPVLETCASFADLPPEIAEDLLLDFNSKHRKKQ